MTEQPLKVVAGAPDRPLVIGDVDIPCYVLEDETRVLSQRGFLRAIGRTGRPVTGHEGGGLNLPFFLAAANLGTFVSKLKQGVASNPIFFCLPDGATTAYGYSALLLPEVCNVYLAARAAGVLHKNQEHIAERAEILVRGLATVGIIALVDEATGYQEIRAQRALAAILEKFIAEELQHWTRTFPYAFYEQIFRLKGWTGPDGAKRPSVIGHYTNDLVYARIAPGLLEELQSRNPTLPTGGRKDRHHQWFTPELGHPKLKEHLAAVTALMRAAPNWNAFKRSLERAFTKINHTIPMALPPGNGEKPRQPDSES